MSGDRGGKTSWLRDFALGAQLAVTGGRGGRIRLALTTVGVALGVIVLLGAASVPNMVKAGEERAGARHDFTVTLATGEGVLARADNTMLVSQIDEEFRGTRIRGRKLSPEGSKPPIPPGVQRLPTPTEVVVSPALDRLLKSKKGELLRPRFKERIIGVIGNEGLIGPNELAFYKGGSPSIGAHDAPHRINSFPASKRQNATLNAALTLLVVMGVVALLVPIAVFVGVAMRFGGEQRDRRMAAMRLVGASSAMTRRLAAGEALVGALLGLLVGALAFYTGRPLIELITFENLSVFAADIQPVTTLAAIIFLVVPLAAVAVTLISMRKVIIEPLGVVRKAKTRQRRVWWRLVPMLAGLALLLPLLVKSRPLDGAFAVHQLAAGATVLLFAVATVLPWFVEFVVRRAGGGGGVAWLLAIRRLRFESGSATRVVSGVAIAIAGAIALQMIFAAARSTTTTATHSEPDRANVVVSPTGSVSYENGKAIAAKFARIPGVKAAYPITQGGYSTSMDKSPQAFYVADCNSLRQIAKIDRCSNGDSFIVMDSEVQGKIARPGQRVLLRDRADKKRPIAWRVPTSARPVKPRVFPDGSANSGIYVTPKALGATQLPDPEFILNLKVDQPGRDAVEHIRNVAANIKPRSDVSVLTTHETDRQFRQIRAVLLLGVIITLTLIGISLLVGGLEQLRDRRRVIATLVAFGTRRSTLSLSLLLQTAIPMILGLALSATVGVGLGTALLSIANVPWMLDWQGIALTCGAGLGVLALVSILSMPTLWRGMRPSGLRTE